MNSQYKKWIFKRLKAWAMNVPFVILHLFIFIEFIIMIMDYWNIEWIRNTFIFFYSMIFLSSFVEIILCRYNKCEYKYYKDEPAKVCGFLNGAKMTVPIPVRESELKGHPKNARHCPDCAPVDKNESQKTKPLLPPRCKHCEKCDTCVIGFNHHCGITNLCVGESTFPPFTCFLFWCTLSFMLGKVFQIFTLLPVACHWFAVSNEDVIWTTNLFGAETFHFLTIPNVSFINIVDLIVGTVFLLFLWHAMTLVVFKCALTNNTLSDKIKYGRAFGGTIKCPYDMRRITQSTIYGFYLNLRYRVWNGVPLVRMINVEESDNFDRMFSVFGNRHSSFIQRAKEVVHTLACFLIPHWWRLSGEVIAHSNNIIATKYFNIPKENEWIKDVESILKSV